MRLPLIKVIRSFFEPKISFILLNNFGIATMVIYVGIYVFTGYTEPVKMAVQIGAIILQVAANFIFIKGHQRTARLIAWGVYNIMLTAQSFNLGLHSGTFIYYIPVSVALIYVCRESVSKKEVALYCISCLVFVAIISVFCPVDAGTGPKAAFYSDFVFKLNFIISFVLTAFFLYSIFAYQVNQNLELRTQKAVAEELARSKENFLSVMSHELRTPLNGIVGAIELLEVERDPIQKRKYIEILKQSSGHMLSLVNDVLDYHKLMMQKMEIKPVPCQLKKMAGHVFNTFTMGFEKKKIAFQLRFDAVPDDHFLMVDDVRLTQVLSNLLSNALKYTDTGHVELVIKKSSRNDEQPTFYFEVKDTGIGIPESRKQHVFEKYNHILDTEKRFSQSSGLGLSISKQIIEMMGGKIEFESQEHVGTRFFFTLSFKSISIDSNTLLKKPPMPDNTNSEPSNMQYKVLVAEDNPINMMIVKRMLNQKNMEVCEAVNGREVIEHLQSSTENFSLILLDLQLPIMTGYEVMEWINVHYPDLPVIAFTANLVDNNDFKKLRKSGFADVLPKPYQSEELYSKIYRYAKIEAAV